MTSAEARFNKSLRPRKPEGSLGRTAQDVHLDSHTAPELCCDTPITHKHVTVCRDQQKIVSPKTHEHHRMFSCIFGSLQLHTNMLLHACRDQQDLVSYTRTCYCMRVVISRILSCYCMRVVTSRILSHTHERVTACVS